MSTRGLIFAGTALLAVVLDQATKYVLRQTLELGSAPVELLPFVSVHHVRNPGVAFSLLSGAGELLVVVGVGLLAMIVWIAARTPADDRITLIGLGALAGGAVGNIIDRVRFGAVVDFIDVGRWPTFNVADIFIVVGVALVVLQTFRRRPEHDAA